MQVSVDQPGEWINTDRSIPERIDFYADLGCKMDSIYAKIEKHNLTIKNGDLTFIYLGWGEPIKLVGINGSEETRRFQLSKSSPHGSFSIVFDFSFDRSSAVINGYQISQNFHNDHLRHEDKDFLKKLLTSELLLLFKFPPSTTV